MGAQTWVGRAPWHHGPYYLWGDIPALMPFSNDRKAPQGTQWFNDGPRTPESLASLGSKSSARKAASARIAKIPHALARHIARVYKPRTEIAA